MESRETLKKSTFINLKVGQVYKNLWCVRGWFVNVVSSTEQSRAIMFMGLKSGDISSGCDLMPCPVLSVAIQR